LIAVTGATGAVGGRVAAQLAERGAEFLRDNPDSYRLRPA
jgi:uncharacterized protein YbjT (DUF2867 family)